MAESELPCLPIAIVLHHIFPELPIKSLFRFKCLDKQFFSIISDPNFKLSSRNRDRVLLISNKKKGSSKGLVHYFVMNNKAHVEKHKTPPTKRRVSYHDLRILGSCNGLILLSVEDKVFLWNPSILGSCTKVLELKCLINCNYWVSSGFCYDGDTKDYKLVVKITNTSPCFGAVGFRSASLKSKEWRCVSFPYNMNSARVGPVANNRLHWLAASHDPMGDPEWDDVCEQRPYRLSLMETPADSIVYFDCSSNMFKMLPLPDPVTESPDEIVELLVIDECLCMMRRISVDSTVRQRGFHWQCDVELLVMKEYGVKESWTSKFIIQDYYNHGSTIALRMDSVVDKMQYDELCFMHGSELHAYNHATKKFERIFELREEYDRSIRYMESSATTKEYYWNGQMHKNIPWGMF